MDESRRVLERLFALWRLKRGRGKEREGKRERRRRRRMMKRNVHHNEEEDDRIANLLDSNQVLQN